MLTPEQEAFLATFADQGIAEQQATADRNTQVELDTAIQAAKATVVADLNAQAQALIDKGMQDFETNVVPTISVSDDLDTPDSAVMAS